MMNRVLFQMEFSRNLRSLITWGVVIGFLVFFTMSFFRSVLQYQQQIANMVQLVPAFAMKMRGFSQLNDIFDILGFYTANNLIYMMLMGSIYSMILAANILLKEEYGRTAEYLMARPLSRAGIFNSKLAVTLLNILMLNIMVSIIGFLSLEIYRVDPYRVTSFFILSGYTLLLNLFFAAAGLLLSVTIKRARQLTSLCVALVMVLYFFYTISRMSGIDGSFGYISPFKWVNIDVLSEGYGLGTWNTMVFAGSTIIMLILAAFLYRRRDLLT